MRRLRPVARHWLAILNLLWAMYVGLPWLAPVLMQVGAPAPARVIYGLYSTQCHQMAQRSYFLFGQQATYGLDELRALGFEGTHAGSLGAILGNEQMGWKVAWSDRMVAMYTATLVFGLLYGVVRSSRRRPLRSISPWLFLLLLIPMALDGGTHVVSDLQGIGAGFRATNQWLATLTRTRLRTSFYAGTAWGSFNASMRLMTGALFGLGSVSFLYPQIDTIVAHHFDRAE